MKKAALFFLTAWLPLAAEAADAIIVAKPAPVLIGNARQGERIFKSHCAMCHSLVQNKVGPRLSGVVGRKAGALPDYNYSLSLKKAGLTWDIGTLDHWLADPSALVSGTNMLLRLDNPQDRADIISYLQTVAVPPR
jgi:cytochrome c